MKKSGCLPLILFVLLCLSLFCNVLLLVFWGTSGMKVAPKLVAEPRFNEETLVQSSSGNRIAVIPVKGIISYAEPGALGDSMVQDLKFAFDQAANDDSVKAVVLAVDSPGGEITASDELFHRVKQLSEKKKVVVYMSSLGASGAYYLSCGADWIMCNANTFTGSIGVIISTLNYESLFGKVGLQSVIFKSGKFKDMLNGARPITEEERDYVQGMVMQSYERFLSIVAKARKLPAESLRNGVADGRILSGRDAHEAKLVDQLGYMEDAYAKARELAGISEAAVVQYKPRFAFDKFLSFFGESSQARIQLDVPGLPVSKLQPGRMYLLPPFFAN